MKIEPGGLLMKMAAAKKTIESSPRAKGSSATSATDPKVDKSSLRGDAIVSDLLKMNFLSSPSACFNLVDHIHEAGDLETVSSFSLENSREATFHMFKKRVVLAVEPI
ncbi:unnamed protein product [Prunus armeniaca]